MFQNDFPKLQGLKLQGSFINKLELRKRRNMSELRSLSWRRRTPLNRIYTEKTAESYLFPEYRHITLRKNVITP